MDVVQRRAALLLTGRWHYAILFIAGGLQSVSVCWPFGFVFVQGQGVWWLQLLSLSVLCVSLHRSASPAQAFLRGTCFAVVWLSTTFWWLYVAMHTYGGLPALLAAVAVLALAGALACYYGAAAALAWRLGAQRPHRAALVFAACWAMAEMARGTWLTGFGWGAAGYAHLDGPLAAYAPWVGAYGLAALAAYLSASLALSVRPARGSVLAGLVVVGAGLGLGAASSGWTGPAGTLSVALLQGNIPQDEKFETGTGVPLALSWYAEQLLRSRADLVVAPETAIPLLPADLPDGYWRRLAGHFQTGTTAAMTGIPLGNYSQGYTNAVLGLQPQAPQPWQYDKHHLVPFGEFIPPLFKWFTRMMNIPLGDFNRGAVNQPPFVWHGQRLAANICYEDLFGEELGARFADPAQAPTIFVNFSNIGWFGDTVAIDQHLQISRMRALEFERPFVRATNTGATVILDHHAHTVAALPRLTRGVLEGTVEGRTGTTPFAWWVSRCGLWPLWLLALAVLVSGWRQRD
jgi:apolipoprotein N-acyltransferase